MADLASDGLCLSSSAPPPSGTIPSLPTFRFSFDERTDGRTEGATSRGGSALICLLPSFAGYAVIHWSALVAAGDKNFRNLIKNNAPHFFRRFLKKVFPPFKRNFGNINFPCMAASSAGVGKHFLWEGEPRKKRGVVLLLLLRFLSIFFPLLQFPLSVSLCHCLSFTGTPPSPHSSSSSPASSSTLPPPAARTVRNGPPLYPSSSSLPFLGIAAPASALLPDERELRKNQPRRSFPASLSCSS